MRLSAPIAAMLVACSLLACGPTPGNDPNAYNPAYPNAGYSTPGYPNPGYPNPGYVNPGNPGYPNPGYPAPAYGAPAGYAPPGYPSPSYGAPGSVPASAGPATPIAPATAAAVTPLLIPLGAQEAPGAQADGSLFAGQFLEGQTLEQPINIQAGKCYTVIAVGYGIQQVDVQLVAQLPPMPATILAQSTSNGPTAVLGGKSTGCFKNPLPIGAPAKVVVRATRGQGMIGAQVFSEWSSHTSRARRRAPLRVAALAHVVRVQPASDHNA